MDLVNSSHQFVAVHPIVTLSIVDHFKRVSKDVRKRVVGVLLGDFIDGRLHATNSYAVPFEEDSKNCSLWYIDHIYFESMADMFYKINKKERIIGWYSTGEKIHSSDLEIDKLLQRYVAHPIYLLVDVQSSSKHQSPLIQAYVTYDKPCSNKKFSKVFTHITCSVAQFEAEEVAVEHLLRDLKNQSSISQTSKICEKICSLKKLNHELSIIQRYFDNINKGKIPINYTIVNNVQNIINFCPDIQHESFINSLKSKTDESFLAIYAGSLVRTVMALHDLVKNQSQTLLIKNQAA